MELRPFRGMLPLSELAHIQTRAHRGSSLEYINRAHENGTAEQLPPIELVRMPSALLLLDGNHRLTVARARGVEAILVNVTIHPLHRRRRARWW